MWTSFYNTDNRHKITVPERNFNFHTNLFIMDTPMMTASSYSTWFHVRRFISKCNQLSHHSYDNSIVCFQSVTIKCTSKTFLGQFWLKEHLIPSMEPLKWQTIHDLHTKDMDTLVCPWAVHIREVRLYVQTKC